MMWGSIYDIMDLQRRKTRDCLVLTDYSFVEYQPTSDLYELLLLDLTPTHDPSVLVSLSPSADSLSYPEEEAVKETTPFPAPFGNRSAAYRCTCTKSRCSKNYCECYRAGRPRSSECPCSHCGNTDSNYTSPPLPESNQSGCKCRKTKCLKRYCVCHSRGLRCSPLCNCVDCDNGKLMQEMSEGNPEMMDDFSY